MSARCGSRYEPSISGHSGYGLVAPYRNAAVAADRRLRLGPLTDRRPASDRRDRGSFSPPGRRAINACLAVRVAAALTGLGLRGIAGRRLVVSGCGQSSGWGRRDPAGGCVRVVVAGHRSRQRLSLGKASRNSLLATRPAGMAGMEQRLAPTSWPRCGISVHRAGLRDGLQLWRCRRRAPTMRVRRAVAA
jgi:hypothetical protein